MKNSWLKIIINIYITWSAVLFAVFFKIAAYRYCAFYIWQLSTALIMLVLLADVTILFHKKRKLLKMDREIELLEQRLEGKE